MKNITYFLITLFFLSVSGFVSSQDNDRLSRLDGSLLWKVSGKDLVKPSYILGTHHFIHLDITNTIAGLDGVLADVEQVVGEIDFSGIEEINLQIQTKMMMPADTSYQDILSAEELERLDKGLKKNLYVGLSEVKMFKPNMILMLYSIAMYRKAHPDFSPTKHEALDAYVQRMAKENNKEVMGLETVDDQIYALVESETLREQAQVLLCSVENADSQEESMLKMEEYYRNGQIQDIYKISFEDESDPCLLSHKQKNALNKDRNDKWLAVLPQIMSGKSSLIAVGVLHLSGEEGLLYQLDQMGYAIEPVR
ncbi:MAG: TraB/GumN family protein [Dysgonomonas sp.]|nr:TraB/GumN family protein [Dysgonomonas sp.]